MSIICCPECKKQVSDSADACPNCGFAVKSYVKKQQDIERIEREAQQEAIAYVTRQMAENEATKRRAEEERVSKLNQTYQKAIALFNQHTTAEVSESRNLFKTLDGWKDSKVYLNKIEQRLEIVAQEENHKQLQKRKVKRITLISALAVLVIFGMIYSLFALIIPTIKYNRAIEDYKDGQYIDACKEFLKLGNFNESQDYFKKSVAILNEHNIACGTDNIIAINNERKVVSTNNNYEDVENVISVSFGSDCLVTLNEYGNIHTYGGYYRTDTWKENIYVASGGNKVVAIQKDGTIQTAGSTKDSVNINQWDNLAMISLNQYHSVGLKGDGTVVADGKNDSSQCDVKDWKDIISVSAGLNHTVGLKADRTVITAGNNDDGQCNTQNWRDIISVVAGSKFTIGLKSDGTLVATGNNDSKQCDIGDWQDIAEIAVSYNKTVGLTENGTVITTSQNEELNKSISKWDNINVTKSPIPEQYKIEPTKETTHPQTEKATQKPTEKPTEAPSLTNPEGNPISIEDRLSQIKDYEGLWYDKSESISLDSTYDYEFTIKKNMTFEIGKYSGAAITMLLNSNIPIKPDGQSYYQVIYDGKKYYHISLTFFKNGVEIDGLDGLDGGDDCNGFYSYDSIVVSE